MRELINVINCLYDDDIESRPSESRNRRDMLQYTGEHVAILGAYSDFLRNTRVLDDINYWNFKRLISAHTSRKAGTFRKPRIVLHLYVTSRGNLVLEWEPALDSDGNNDFLYNHMWFNLTPPFEEPRNRLFRIDNFSLFSESYGSPSELTLLERAQIGAVVELVKSVINSLSSRFDVSESNGILRESSIDDPLCKVDYYLLPTSEIDEIVSAYNAQVFEEQGDYWIQTELVEKLGVKADDLISAYFSCGESYSKTAKKLAPTLRKEYLIDN
jgi:hypothetical protein